MRQLRDTLPLDTLPLDSASYLHTTNSLTFFISRHGQAEHNHITTLQKKVFRDPDTNLTKAGEAMAVNAGRAINAEFGTINTKLGFGTFNVASGTFTAAAENMNGMVKFDYCYGSDLIRTHKTFSGIISNIDDSFLPIILKLTVLPCAHELEFRDDGNCDAKPTLTSLFTNENKMQCTRPRELSCNQIRGYTRKNTLRNILSVVDIDWILYDTFYGNSTRTDTTRDKTICKNTSMIEECIKHIVATEAAEATEAAKVHTPSGGMKLRNRQRKTKTKRKINRSKIYTYSKRRQIYNRY